MHGAPSQLSLYEKHNRNRQNAKKKIAYLSLGRLNAPTRSGAAETAKPPIPSTNDTEEKLHHQTSPNTSIPSPGTHIQIATYGMGEDRCNFQFATFFSRSLARLQHLPRFLQGSHSNALERLGYPIPNKNPRALIYAGLRHADLSFLSLLISISNRRSQRLSMARVRVALALCVLLAHALAWEARAASYTVGDSAGWDISADLPSWAVGKTFNVGDVLGMINHCIILC
jgi:hypothetical protein